MQLVDLSPDLIVTNGRFYTLDSENTVAQAVAIKEGRIVAVGEGTAVDELAGPRTRKLDLNRLLPSILW